MRRRILHHYTVTQNGTMANDNDNDNTNDNPGDPPAPLSPPNRTKRSVNNLRGWLSTATSKVKEANQRGASGSPADKRRRETRNVSPDEEESKEGQEEEVTDAIMTEATTEEEENPDPSTKDKPKVSFGTEETVYLGEGQDKEEDDEEEDEDEDGGKDDKEDDEEDKEEEGNSKNGKDKKTYLTATKKNLATTFEKIPALGQSLARKYFARLTIRFPIEAVAEGPGSDKLKGNDPTSLLRKALKGLLEIAKKYVDSTSVLYTWDSTDKDERNAITKASRLPERIADLKVYGDNLRALYKGGDLFAQFRFGFNIPFQDFVANFTEELKARNMWMKINPIQKEAFVVCLGWIPYTGSNHDEICLKDKLNHFSIERVENHGKEAIEVGVEIKPVFDGADQNERKKRSTEEKNKLRAIHLYSAKRNENRARRVIKAAFQHADFRRDSNLPHRLVRPYKNGETPSYYHRYKKVVNRHKKFGSDQTKWTVGMNFFDDPKDIDAPLSFFEEIEDEPGTMWTTRRLIMGQADDKGRRLFLTVDLQDRGRDAGLFSASYPVYRKTEAESRWKYLGKYLEKQFGAEALEYFCQEALDEWDKVGWDDDKKCPISAEDLEIADILDDDDFDLFADGDKKVLDETKIDIDTPVRPTELDEEAKEDKDPFPSHDDASAATATSAATVRDVSPSEQGGARATTTVQGNVTSSAETANGSSAQVGS
jgi:hypothetical protein